MSLSTLRTRAFLMRTFFSHQRFGDEPLVFARQRADGWHQTEIQPSTGRSPTSPTARRRPYLTALFVVAIAYFANPVGFATCTSSTWPPRPRCVGLPTTDFIRGQILCRHNLCDKRRQPCVRRASRRRPTPCHRQTHFFLNRLYRAADARAERAVFLFAPALRHWGAKRRVRLRRRPSRPHNKPLVGVSFFSRYRSL